MGDETKPLPGSITYAPDYKSEKPGLDDVIEVYRAYNEAPISALVRQRDLLKARIADLEAQNARLREALAYCRKTAMGPYVGEVYRRIDNALAADEPKEPEPHGHGLYKRDWCEKCNPKKEPGHG